MEEYNEMMNSSIETSIELRIAKAIASVKRTSERVIGITDIKYNYSHLTYEGTTVRPEPITPLERAVVGIIDIDGDASLEKIGMILGLDVVHDIAENYMLQDAINRMKDYGMLEGDETFFSLTDKGKEFVEEGERPVTYNKTFAVSYDSNHPDYLYLEDDFSSSKVIKEAADCECLSVLNDIHIIKSFAEVQAPGVQNEKNRYILQSALLKNAEKVEATIYAIFLQSIRNENDYRVFAYDDSQGIILPHFSELIQNDREWTSFLLEQCINNSLKLSEEDGGWTIVSPEQEKNEEQKAIEAELIQCEDEETDGKESVANDLERLHKKAIYDQISFEFELNKIFSQDNPDEVWIISPFVSWSFVKVRVKQFEPLLKANKRIFIAYSEPYDSRQTISPEAERIIMKEIERLSKTYPNFYCVELPKFHTKQVLEVKNGQCVLFNGSFNVLSFDNVSAGRKVSREEMSLVHYQVAASKHQEYIETFASIYMNRILENISQCKDTKSIAQIKSERVDYLHQISEDKDIFIDFYTEFDEKTLQANNTAWYDECDVLAERMNQAISKGTIVLNDFKAMSVSYQELIKKSIALTISRETVSNLECIYDNLDKLPKVKSTSKEASKKDNKSSGTLYDEAFSIIKEGKLGNEENVALFIAALCILHTNRAFKNKSEGTKYFSKLLRDTNASSYFSVFEFSPNKFGKSLDVTIGIGGYLFRLFGICQPNMESKLSAIRKSKETARLYNVSSRNLEKTFMTLLNK